MKKKLLTAIACTVCLSMTVMTGCGGSAASGGSDSQEQDAAAEAKALEDVAWAQEYDKILSDPYGFDGCESSYAASASFARDWFGVDSVFNKYYLYDLDKNGTPELYLWQEKTNMTLVSNYNGKDTVVSGMFSLDRLNPETCELLEQSTWQGETGSEKNEWTVFAYDDKGVLDETLYFDYDNPQYEGVCIFDLASEEMRENASMDEYNKLYDEHVKPSIDITEIQKYDLNDRSAFAEFGVSAENASEVNEMEAYNETFHSICNAIENMDGEAEGIPYDLGEAIAFSEGGVSACYALEDLDKNGVRELIIGSSEQQPLGVYTVDNGKVVLLSELSYFYGILSDGTIHTLQGNGIQEGHPDGFFYRLDGSKLTEVSDPGLDEMELTWSEMHLEP